MTRCPTSHNDVRCRLHAGHEKDCEQRDRSGILTAKGQRLDEIGDDFGIRRDGMSDEGYRLRLWRAAT